MDVSPVPVILQAFPEHSHNLIAGHHVVGQIRDVGHLRAGRSPWVVGCGFSHLTIATQVSDNDIEAFFSETPSHFPYSYLDLSLRVVLDQVLQLSTEHRGRHVARRGGGKATATLIPKTNNTT